MKKSIFDTLNERMGDLSHYDEKAEAAMKMAVRQHNKAKEQAKKKAEAEATKDRLIKEEYLKEQATLTKEEKIAKIEENTQQKMADAHSRDLLRRLRESYIKRREEFSQAQIDRWEMTEEEVQDRIDEEMIKDSAFNIQMSIVLCHEAAKTGDIPEAVDIIQFSLHEQEEALMEELVRVKKQQEKFKDLEGTHTLAHREEVLLGVIQEQSEIIQAYVPQ